MKALGDYIHEKGLKFGLYESPDFDTCASKRIEGFFPGSKDHEQEVADLFASWGVDYIKYDACGTYDMTSFELMRDALANTGRDIVYSINPAYNYDDFIMDVANSWRTTQDIKDYWGPGSPPDPDGWARSVTQIIDENAPLYYLAGPGHWNDPDMLEVGNGGMNNTEYRSHFSMWAIMAAPLIAGNDLRNMSSETLEILTNEEVIAVNQDPLGIQGTRVRDDGDLEVWYKKMIGNGVRAVALFNRSGSTGDITVSWNEIDLASGNASVRDLWEHADKGSYSGSYTASVPSHGVVMLEIVGRSDSYVSDLIPTFASNGWGPMEKDMSNGERPAGDGQTITLNSITYTKGLGVHAASDVRYNLGGKCTVFIADIGVDDEVGSNGSVVFQVYADGIEKYDSGMMTGSSATKYVDIDVTGANELQLVVNDSGDGKSYDHADWADAYVLCSGVPAPWQYQDVGAVGQAGNATYSDGIFAVDGGGADIWGTSDGFHYVYQPLEGDGQIVARVVDLENTHAWAKAGVMIRETIDAGSKHAMMVLTPGKGLAFQRRITTSGSSTHSSGGSAIAPYWVKLVLSGNTISSYKSSNGSDWAPVGYATISLASSMLIGLAVTAHNDTTLATAHFDNVSVIAEQAPAPYALHCSSGSAPFDGSDPLCDEGVFNSNDYPDGVYVYVWKEDDIVSVENFTTQCNGFYHERRERYAPWEALGGAPIVDIGDCMVIATVYTPDGSTVDLTAGFEIAEQAPAPYALHCSSGSAPFDGSDPLCDEGVFNSSDYPDGIYVYVWKEDGIVSVEKFTTQCNGFYHERRERYAPYEALGGAPIMEFGDCTVTATVYTPDGSTFNLMADFNID